MRLALLLVAALVTVGVEACTAGDLLCACLPNKTCLKNLECVEATQLCDEKDCGAVQFVTTLNSTSCFASVPYGACGELTWSAPRPNALPCAVAASGAPKDACVELAFEPRFGEELTLSAVGSLLTVKLRHLKPGEVAPFGDAGTWTKQTIDATATLNFRLDFDGPDGTGQTSLRWFTRPCLAATTRAPSGDTLAPSTPAVAASTTAAPVASPASTSAAAAPLSAMVSLAGLLFAAGSCALLVK